MLHQGIFHSWHVLLPQRANDGRLDEVHMILFTLDGGCCNHDTLLYVWSDIMISLAVTSTKLSLDPRVKNHVRADSVPMWIL